MPRRTQGSIYRTKTGYGIRWPENGQRPHRDGFNTRTDARRWFAENVALRLDRGHAPSPDITFDAFCAEYLERWGADVSARTTRRPSRNGSRRLARGSALGSLRELEGAADDIVALAGHAADRRPAIQVHPWHCVRCSPTAQRWGYITRNPAAEALARTRQPRGEETTAVHPAPPGRDRRRTRARATRRSSPSSAETGLRTNEWPAA